MALVDTLMQTLGGDAIGKISQQLGTSDDNTLHVYNDASGWVRVRGPGLVPLGVITPTTRKSRPSR